jgi:hypothetical protein
MNDIKTILKAEKRRILRELRDKSLLGAVMVFIDVIFDTVFALLIPQLSEDGTPKGFVRITPLLSVFSIFTLLDCRHAGLYSVDTHHTQRQNTCHHHCCHARCVCWTRSQESAARIRRLHFLHILGHYCYGRFLLNLLAFTRGWSHC